jgi:hypothetical protein
MSTEEDESVSGDFSGTIVRREKKEMVYGSDHMIMIYLATGTRRWEDLGNLLLEKDLSTSWFGCTDFAKNWRKEGGPD